MYKMKSDEEIMKEIKHMEEIPNCKENPEYQDLKSRLKGRQEATKDILEKLKIAKECVDFKRITCDTGCKNYLCILNNKFGVKGDN